jgi:endo-beta-N-acetylglucosaminidase D
VNVINSYTAGIVHSCQNLTVANKVIVADVIALFLNETTAASTAASAGRTAINETLVRNSWLYFAGITTLFAGLSVSNHLCKNDVNWRNLMLENLALVSLLGLYEWMFFSTIVLKYQSISIQELDAMVIHELLAAC